MPYITQVSRNSAEALYKATHGISPKALTEELKTKDAAIKKAVTMFYTKMNMSVEAIAQDMALEVAYVQAILVQQKLIKK